MVFHLKKLITAFEARQTFNENNETVWEFGKE